MLRPSFQTATGLHVSCVRHGNLPGGTEKILIRTRQIYKLLEFFSIFEGILMQISEETASNLHTSAFSISLRSCQIGMC
jgi:hypothetical protein